MSRKRKVTGKLTPDEQVNIHLAMQGGNRKYSDVSEECASKDNESGKDDDTEESLSPLEQVRRYLQEAAGTVYSGFEFRLPVFVIHGFDFDDNKNWQVNAVMADNDKPDSEDDVRIQFLCFSGKEVHTRECLMSELSEADRRDVGWFAEFMRQTLIERNSPDQSDDKFPIATINGKPVYTASDYESESTFVLCERILGTYEDMEACAPGLFIPGDKNIGTIIPVKPTYNIVLDQDCNNEPRIFEIVGVSVFRETGEPAVVGHLYNMRNSRKRMSEDVLPLNAMSVDVLTRILDCMELFFELDQKEQDD